MPFPRLSQLRPAAEAAPLPALLTLLLGLMLIVQLALPIEAELPAIDAGRPRVTALGRIDMAPVGIYPAISARNIFGLRASAGPSHGEAASVEITLLGTASARGAAVGVFGGGEGTVTLRPGQRLGPWRIVAIGRGAAIVAGPEGRQTLRVGQSTSTTPGAPAGAEP